MSKKEYNIRAKRMKEEKEKHPTCEDCSSILRTNDCGYYCDNVSCKSYDVDILAYEEEK